MNEELSPLLKGLNKEQKEAVLENSRSLLVFAGAGSGKTRVITTKIAYCVKELGINPWQILAVTFTNNACKEMKERVQRMVEDVDISEMNIRTFHAFGVWILRRWGARVGLSPDFKIYDEDDSATLLQQCFPDEKKKDMEAVAKKISYYKDKMAKPPAYEEKLTKQYYAYEERLKATGNVDFADMIIKTNELLQNDPEVLAWVHRRFKVILVDEYQDSNLAQFEMLRLLVGPDCFVCVVGDDDQSIYRFRGAEVKNILSFPDVFPNTRVIKLEQNYRSTGSILRLADDIISHNKMRSQKTLWTERGDGPLPNLIYVEDEFDEAEKVAQIIQRNGNYAQTAILYRTNAQSMAFENKFIYKGIPYHLIGSLKFYSREEVKDAVSLISLLNNSRDSVAFQRMVNKPARGIGDTSIRKILDLGLLNGLDVIEACRMAIEKSIVKGPAQKGLKEFLQAYEGCQEIMGQENNSFLLQKALELFSVLKMYKERDEEESDRANSRLANLEQLVNLLMREDFANGTEGINAFLEYASLEPAALGDSTGNDKGGVTLITMHNTKGREYDCVFMVGMEEGIIPSSRSLEDEEDVEEERRICYVAITRARNDLFILCAKQRRVWGSFSLQNPSRFILEAPVSHMKVIGAPRSRSGSFSDSYTPSWQRKESYKAPAPVVPPMPKVAPKTVSPSNYKVNDRIHSSFYGDGTVVGIKKFGGRDILEVKFDSGRQGSFAADKVNFTKK